MGINIKTRVTVRRNSHYELRTTQSVHKPGQGQYGHQQTSRVAAQPKIDAFWVRSKAYMELLKAYLMRERRRIKSVGQGRASQVQEEAVARK